MIVVGNETHGLSSGWRDACDEVVAIAMVGTASSLNAAWPARSCSTSRCASAAEGRRTTWRQCSTGSCSSCARSAPPGSVSPPHWRRCSRGPERLALPLAGYTASQGYYSVTAAIAWATAGSLAGALVLYWLGAAWGLERICALADRIR